MIWAYHDTLDFRDYTVPFSIPDYVDGIIFKAINRENLGTAESEKHREGLSRAIDYALGADGGRDVAILLNLWDDPAAAQASDENQTFPMRADDTECPDFTTSDFWDWQVPRWSDLLTDIRRTGVTAVGVDCEVYGTQLSNWTSDTTVTSLGEVAVGVSRLYSVISDLWPSAVFCTRVADRDIEFDRAWRTVVPDMWTFTSRTSSTGLMSSCPRIWQGKVIWGLDYSTIGSSVFGRYLNYYRDVWVYTLNDLPAAKPTV